MKLQQPNVSPPPLVARQNITFSAQRDGGFAFNFRSMNFCASLNPCRVIRNALAYLVMMSRLRPAVAARLADAVDIFGTIASRFAGRGSGALEHGWVANARRRSAALSAVG